MVLEVITKIMCLPVHGHVFTRCTLFTQCCWFLKEIYTFWIELHNLGEEIKARPDGALHLSQLQNQLYWGPFTSVSSWVVRLVERTTFRYYLAFLLLTDLVFLFYLSTDLTNSPLNCILNSSKSDQSGFNMMVLYIFILLFIIVFFYFIIILLYYLYSAF